MAQRKDSFFLAAKSGGKDRSKKVESKKTTKEKNGAEVEKKEKRPFDKKTYRLKKYSNKYKLAKWEEERKKRLTRDYRRNVKNDVPLGSYRPVNFDEELSNSDEDESERGGGNLDEATLGVDVTDAISAGRFVRHPDLIAAKAVAISKFDTKEIPNWKNAKQMKAMKEKESLNLSREERKREADRSKQEREQKLNEYRKKKAERFKKLSRKTKKGQPVMTGRLELLLEKIVGAK